MSCSRPRSPVTILVGRPLAAAARSRTRPGRRCRWRRDCRGRAPRAARRQERLLVADRHARGGVDEVAVAMRADRARCQARFGEHPLSLLGCLRTRSPPRGLAAASQVRTSSRRARAPRAASPRPAGGVGAQSAAARRVGSFEPPSRSTAISYGARGARPARRAAACWSASLRNAGRGPGQPHGQRLVSQQQVVDWSHHVGAVVRAAADLGGRLREDRKAGCGRQMAEGLAQLGVELAPGDDHPRSRLRRCVSRPHPAGTRRARDPVS